MTDIIVEYLKQGVNLFLNSLTIVMIVGTFAVISVVSSAVGSQEAANVKMAEVAEFNQFDGTQVRGSDVIAALMKYRSEIELVVTDGAVNKINSTTWSSIKFTLKDLTTVVEPDAAYKSEISYDANGVLTKITFEKI